MQLKDKLSTNKLTDLLTAAGMVATYFCINQALLGFYAEENLTEIQPMTELQRKQPRSCTNSFSGKRLSILASCMANLSEFHIVFSSRALIRLNKDAFEGHLCQTVNNFVKQN